MTTHTTHTDPTVVIRAARGPDGPGLERLARLDSQRPLAGDRIVVAERDGELLAARSGGRLIADPFRPTADLVALLRVQAGDAERRPSRARVPHLRAA